MSNSLYEGHVDYDESTHDNGRPLSSALARTVQNNIVHLADSMGQVHINWIAPDSSSQFGTGNLTLASFAYASWRSHPFVLRTRPDGTSYRMRVRVRTSTSTTGAVYVIPVLHTRRADPESDAHDVLGGSLLPNAARIAAPASAGWTLDGVHGDPLYLPASSRRETIATLTTIGGTGVSVEPIVAQLSIFFGRIGGAASDTATLRGVYAAEYIGA